MPTSSSDLQADTPVHRCIDDHSWGNYADCFWVVVAVVAPDPYDPSKSYASVPNKSKWLLRDYRRLWNKASYNHDVRYGSQIYSRDECDSIFYAQMLEVCPSTDRLCKTMAGVWYGEVSKRGAGHVPRQECGRVSGSVDLVV